MYKQFSIGSSELNHWLDIVAKAAIDVFQLNSNEITFVKGEKIPTSKKNKKRVFRFLNASVWVCAWAFVRSSLIK